MADNNYFPLIIYNMQYKFLIVDTCELNRLILRMMLAKQFPKANIEELCCGLSVLDVIKSGKVYDIIFIDVQILSLNGISCTKKLRKLGYKHPIIAVTSYADNNTIQECLQSGLNNVVIKPVEKKLLFKVINSYLIGNFLTIN
jgi:CheY-like chemotaxis protein